MGIMGLGISSVSGISRDPTPAAIIIAFIGNKPPTLLPYRIPYFCWDGFVNLHACILWLEAAFFDEQIVDAVDDGLPGGFDDVFGDTYRTPLTGGVGGINEYADFGGGTGIAV